MAGLTVVQLDAAQWKQASQAIAIAFLEAGPDDDNTRDHLRPIDRRFALKQGDQIVGGCVCYEFDLTLPGGTTAPAAGLAAVGILPTVQGGGGLRLLIDAHLRNSHSKGDAVSVLMASESGLYSRFGYAAATEMAEYRLDTRAFALKSALDDLGTIRLVNDMDEARVLCAGIHAMQQQAGELQRSSDWWEQVIHAGKRSWLGGGPQFVAVHYDASGDADSYALYVVESLDDINDGNIRARLVLRELVALNTTAEQAMFQYLCKVAWVRELRWILAPVDPLIKYKMKDPRQLAQVSRYDMLWMRVLDMPRLLSQRVYHSDAVLDFEYHDDVIPENSGCYRLVAVAGGGSKVERIAHAERPSLKFGPSQLAAILLGGTRVIHLHHLGEIQGSERDIRCLDQLLLTDLVPFNLSRF